jgi:ethylmalonyl-CoA mutase
VVGLSILSGSHAELIPAVLRELDAAGASVPVVVGGIIPPGDEAALRAAGVARVYTPKDFEVSRIMGDIVDVVAEHHGVAAVP